MLNKQSLEKEMTQEIDSLPDLEAKLDIIRVFKNKYVKKLQAEDHNHLDRLPEIFKDLSLIADTLVEATLKLAEKEVQKNYGIPSYTDNLGNISESEFAIVALGKWGGEEIHYGSDLDLIFLYTRDGETRGRKKISNKEYYILLAQKLISFLTAYTFHGYAYKIDTQLRPSGNQGALVSSLNAYFDYQRNKAQFWEKQALLKARFVTGSPSFGSSLKGLFQQLIFSKDFPADLNAKIHHMRMRMEKENGRETARRLHYKLGFGGLTDIEFLVQYLQLKTGKVFENFLSGNTLEALQKMGEKGILKKGDYTLLRDAYLFYRLLETRMEVNFDLREGYIDPESHLLENLAELMGEISQASLLEHFQKTREDVRRIYLAILKIE